MYYPVMLGRDADGDDPRDARVSPAEGSVPVAFVSVFFADVVLPEIGEPWPEPSEVEIVLPPTALNALGLRLFEADTRPPADC